MTSFFNSEILDGSLNDFVSLQRPFYWPWGIGSIGNANNTKWPRREDRLKFRKGKQKTTTTIHQSVNTFRPGTTSAFVDDYVIPSRTTANYYADIKNYQTSFYSPYCNGTDCRSSTYDMWPLSTQRSDAVVGRPTTTSSYPLPGGNRSVIINNSTEIFASVGNSVNNGGNVTFGTFGLIATYASNVHYVNNASDYELNGAANTTWLDDEEASSTELAIMVSTAISLGLVILATVIGNVFVIAAILLERNLQSVANYLILSLAVADLLVACLVMPLGAVYEVSKQWTLGPELCDMWTSSDVLCCTASILHLVAIALDRYWAVTNIDYIHQRTARRIGFMILVIWLVATSVCIAPLLGWKDAEWESRIFINQTCLVSQDIGYQIFATASSFYVPLLVILILYWRIFQTARKRIRRRGGQGGTSQPRNPAAGGVVAGAAGGSGGIAAAVVAVIGRPLPTISETTTAFTTVSSTNTSPEKHPLGNGIEPDLPTADCFSSYQHSIPYPIPIKLKKSKEAADSKRERKAAKTLAIITGAFVICWLPFFILAILLPACKTCEVNPHLVSFFLWLGYLNSTINPIIYTIFSPEFRHAFKRLLCGRKSNIRRRNVRQLGPRYFE